MTFTVANNEWKAPANRLPSRHISVEKHAALNQMIDDLLHLQVIQPSRATAWSQVHLVFKPTKGWQLTMNTRNLKAITVCELFPTKYGFMFYTENGDLFAIFIEDEIRRRGSVDI